MAKIHEEVRLLNMLERNLKSQNQIENYFTRSHINGPMRCNLSEETIGDSVLNKDNFSFIGPQYP